MNNSHHSNGQRYPNRQLVEQKKNSHEHVPLPLLFKAITEEAKYNKNFANAEWLYEEVMADYHSREHKERYFTDADDRLFAMIVGTMVRYASTPERAMHYATLFYKNFDERIRTPSRELVIFTNLIFAHTNQPTPDNMKIALEVYKIALQVGVYKHDPAIYMDSSVGHSFSNPIEVFTTVSKKVLLYYNLFLSPDKTELVPSSRTFSR
ncbi:hypothetical protein FB192DRAFT_1352342 [Mucor lusitanicus]|uniref:Uncharacterized protein n=2 Tax=Mucor circinelloides f. lusitanicus TaxID=29924 RepID=A0A162QIU5_MUCCL|nr:hypothetical protein FB192DRAFT_1352342 [Mucor lusitanicus]OAD02400.1 hypothetical protein MUCCIDRAFT_111780 [Mucor lusitanicus CBS 277.49]